MAVQQRIVKSIPDPRRIHAIRSTGRRWAPALADDLPGYHRGRPPRNEGAQYPADPPTIEEIIEVMRTLGERPTVSGSAR